MTPEGDQKFLFALSIVMLCAVGVVCTGVTIACALVFTKTSAEQSRTFAKMLERANALQMATVILIVVSACALRAVSAISAEAVVSLFSGVAGYVLGGSAPLFRAPKRDDETD